MNKAIFDKAAGYFPDVCFERQPDLGILLGSGWGESLQMDEVIARFPYADIPGLGGATVAGHTGEFVLYVRGKQVCKVSEADAVSKVMEYVDSLR